MIISREGWLLSGLICKKCNHLSKNPNLFVVQISLASCPYQWGGIFYGIDSLDSVAGVLKINQNTVLLTIFERAVVSCEFVCLATANGHFGCLCMCCRIDLQSHMKGYGCSFMGK